MSLPLKIALSLGFLANFLPIWWMVFNKESEPSESARLNFFTFGFFTPAALIWIWQN